MRARTGLLLALMAGTSAAASKWTLPAVGILLVVAGGRPGDEEERIRGVLPARKSARILAGVLLGSEREDELPALRGDALLRLGARSRVGGAPGQRCLEDRTFQGNGEQDDDPVHCVHLLFG